MIAEEGLHDAG
jgi:hypothetical protein